MLRETNYYIKKAGAVLVCIRLVLVSIWVQILLYLNLLYFRWRINISIAIWARQGAVHYQGPLSDEDYSLWFSMILFYCPTRSAIYHATRQFTCSYRSKLVGVLISQILCWSKRFIKVAIIHFIRSKGLFCWSCANSYIVT